jgi:peroxiredoxin Q/BCP
MIGVGHKVPDFSLPNQDGKVRSLRDFAGQWLVLYVYPKDDTPGCTMQGRAFTAAKGEFEHAGVRVVGVSSDDEASHRRWCDKFGLTVELLADVDATLIHALGITQSAWRGNLFWDRTTLVVDPQGVVRKIYEKVVPDRHDRVLLADLAELRGHRVPPAHASQPTL